MMFWLKACPRCSGDLHLEVDEMGDKEIYCVQCGFRKFGSPLVLTRLMGAAESKEAPAIPWAA